MLNTLEAAAWLAALALLLKMVGYQVPFAHHFDGLKETTPVETTEPVKPTPDPFDEGQVASFEDYWEQAGEQ